MDEAALRARDAQLVRRWEQLHQSGSGPPLDQMDKHLDAEHVVEIHDQLVVAFGQRDIAWQPPPRATVCTARTAPRRAPCAMAAISPSAMFQPRGQDHAPADHPRQERCACQWAPAPTQIRPCDALLLECAQEPVHAQTAQREVVGRRQSAEYFAIKPRRPQHHPPRLNGDAQIGDQNLTIARRAGLPEEGDLVRAQQRTAQDVAQASLR